MAGKKEKVEMNVVDVERDIYGYTGGELEYTPAVFELLNVPEDKWFSVVIKPLSDGDCDSIRCINQGIQVEGFLWCSEKGIDPTKMNDSESLAFYKKLSSLDRPAEKFSIVFPYIVGLKNHKEESMTRAVWEAMPNKIREDIYNKIVEISNLSAGETINLS